MRSTEFIHRVEAVAIKRYELAGGEGLDIIIRGELGAEKVVTLFTKDGSPVKVEGDDQ